MRSLGRILSVAVLALATGCAAQNAEESVEALASVGAPSPEATPTTEASATAEALDPECEAAFVAGIAARDEDPTAYLDPALSACETYADFRAVARAYPDAIDIPLAAFTANRCQASEENLATPLCSELNPHD